MEAEDEDTSQHLSKFGELAVERERDKHYLVAKMLLKINMPETGRRTKSKFIYNKTKRLKLML